MRPMVLLFLALFNSILGLSVLFPILGPLGRELGLSEWDVGNLSTGYAFMQFLFSPFWGARSEARGRKPILIIGIVGFAIGFYAFAGVAHLGLTGALRGTPLFLLLLATRVVGGALSSATLPTAQAWAADLSEREQRTSAMAVIGAAFGLGVIVGPGLGAGIIALTGSLLAPVYFSATVAVLNAIFVAWRLREPERRTPRPVPTPIRSVARGLWPLLAVGFATTVAAIGMEQTVAFYFMDRLDLDARGASKVVGLALMAYGLVAVLCQGVLARRANLTPLTLIRAGLPISVAGFALFVFAHGYGALFGAVVLQAFGQGLVLPGVTAAISLAASDDDQGAAGGLHSSAQALGRTLGPTLATRLYETRVELPYMVSAALLAVVLLAVLALPSIVARKGAPGG